MRTLEDHLEMKIDLAKERLASKSKTLKEIAEMLLVRLEQNNLKSINSLGEVQGVGREVDLLCKELRTHLDTLEDYKAFEQLKLK
jgi:endonuclease III